MSLFTKRIDRSKVPLSYTEEFFRLIVVKLVHSGCRHCHGTGIEAWRGEQFIPCRCVLRGVQRYKAIASENYARRFCNRPELREAA